MSTMYPKEKSKSGQILRFFDDETGKIIEKPYEEDHLPFFYTTLTEKQIMNIFQVQTDKYTLMVNGKPTWNSAKVVDCKRIELTHPRTRQPIKLTKVIVTKPHYVTNTKEGNGLSQLIDPKFVYNNHVKYHEVYCYENNLSMGMPYDLETMKLDVDWKAIKKHPIYVMPEIEKYMGKMPKTAFDWLMSVFTTPFPQFKEHILAVDIECDFNYRDAIDAFEAVAPISSVTLSWYRDGNMIHLTFALDDVTRNTKASSFDERHENHMIREFSNERELVKEAVKYLVGMPQKFIVGFNVDEFDIPYLCSRMNYLNIKNNKIWGYKTIVENEERSYERVNKGVSDKYLIDLYRFFSNPSIKNYAFKGKYDRNSLNDVSKSLLDEQKYDYEGRITNLPTQELCYYNAQDNSLVLDLCTFDNEIVMQLIMMTMRIATKAVEDACRSKVASVILNLMRRLLVYYKMPNINKYELEQIGGYHSVSVTGKKFAGAIVLEPVMGTHFNLVVADVASLYPTMIVNHNLSYDTMNCGHPECKNNKIYPTLSVPIEKIDKELKFAKDLKSIVPSHHVCTRYDGTFSTMVGFVKDVRVYYFKQHKDDVIGYKAVEQYLKVVINASYGVNAFDRFPFFCAPSAECTTATGKQTTLSIKKKFEEIGALVIGGDTDSVFLTRLKEEAYEEVVNYIRNTYNVDLEVEERGIVIVFHAKKNYYVVELKKDGSKGKIIKGLVGKKKHTPRIVKDAFKRWTDIIRDNCSTLSDIPHLINKLEASRKSYELAIMNRSGTLDDYSIGTTLSRTLSDYKANVPQVRAAKKLLEVYKQKSPYPISDNLLFKKGSVIEYVHAIKPKKKKIKHVLPIELADMRDIDTIEYINILNSVYSQLILPIKMAMPKKEIKQTSIGDFGDGNATTR